MKGLKIDAFCHVIPIEFKNMLLGAVHDKPLLERYVEPWHSVWDIDRRRQIMDRYDGLMQILSIGAPPIEQFVSDKEKAADLAKLANDEMAGLVYKYPDYFVAAVACLPINHIDAALKEIDGAIINLKFRGILIHT